MTDGAAVRFAVITDVHANRPALDAVLAKIDAVECGFIVHTGDAIGIGPYPAETLDRLVTRSDIRFVMGNHAALVPYALVTVHRDGELDVDFGATPYDRAELLAALDERGVPARGVIRSIFLGITQP